MASAAPTPVDLDISGTFGISYIGAMVAMALYGITTLQSYLYYMYYPKDRPSLKVLVATIWFLETLQVVLVCHAMYHYLIVNYANPLSLGVGVWSLFISILANIIISTLVQLFFAVRVHILSKGMWWLSTLIMLAILAHLAFGLETVILMLILKDLEKLPSITYTAALPFAVTAVFPDVLIACSLCYFLQSVKSGFRGTNALLNTLMIYAVNRCLLTSVVVIIEMILFKVLPDSFYFLAVDFCVGKLYANTLLATLNTRQSLRGRGYDDNSLSLSNPTSSSRSVPTPQFRHAVQLLGHGHHNDPVELTDLRATWPSGLTYDSADSAPGVQSDLHRTSKRAKKDDLDIIAPVDVVSDIETQGSESQEREPQKYVSFTP